MFILADCAKSLFEMEKWQRMRRRHSHMFQGQIIRRVGDHAWLMTQHDTSGNSRQPSSVEKHAILLSLACRMSRTQEKWQDRGPNWRLELRVNAQSLHVLLATSLTGIVQRCAYQLILAVYTCICFVELGLRIGPRIRAPNQSFEQIGRLHSTWI